MYSVLRLPENESYFDESFRDYIDKYITLWRNAHIEAPLPHKLYTDSDQHDFEYETGRMINFIDKDFRKYPAKERQQSAWRERMIKSLRKFAITSFQFPEKHCDIIFSREYLASTIEFIHQGREFDQHMQPEELAQALRNVWVMNCLQLFMGRRPSLTPSIFAYSMLYPYTDNHLDNPDLSIETKELACRRLGLRLSGQPLDPCNPHEAAVFHLISMIEGDFPRALFPEVYSSLLAIHSGQVQSLKQQHQTDLLDEQQLLRISVTKGGSSVLVDGWLVDGTLCREQADFFFGYGVLLQLLDDLQDMARDRAAGHQTMFTRAETTGQLEGLTNRLWAFIHHVLNRTDCFSNPQALELRDLIRHNSTMLMLRAIAECAESFSDEYLRHMERFSPLRFAYLRYCGKDIKSRFEKIWPGLARRRKLKSVFDLLGVTGQISLSN